jgi:hypothetical protein
MARWDELFADLEGQLDAEAAAALDAEVAALQAAAWGRTAWLERLRAAAAATVRLRLVDGSLVAGVVDRVGPDWVLLSGDDDVLLPSAAVVELTDLPPRGAAEPSAVLARLGLAHALRSLAAGGEPVLLSRLVGPPLRGLVVRVGRDHLDVAPEDADAGAAAAAVVTVPFAALVAVRPV